LDWKTTNDGGKFGAPHASDIQLVFDNIGKAGSNAEGSTAQKMADIMSETFIKFAKTGNPNNKSIPNWKPYTMAKRETMVFDVPTHLENDPRGDERKIFEKVPYVQPGT
jgi:para-nitrobenzyl esterase